jgi:hypothetical protein
MICREETPRYSISFSNRDGDQTSHPCPCHKLPDPGLVAGDAGRGLDSLLVPRNPSLIHNSPQLQSIETWRGVCLHKFCGDGERHPHTELPPVPAFADLGPNSAPRPLAAP